ncbi:enoyl-CoA hydratase/isomerase family protein [Azospirillum doebereinerae]|uniref:enoyl-CoA hydratase/isomerase family protein n=1 Tax=Azospirillum doebereinerae TaxID=92933 RepID=UPI001EE5F2C2|nr:enoyl-CoA hydratase/isomerase family protein [Azospirillum doebereinerae]MCG5243688.1 enoyl-CoA hydratase/isomerase family protein [Azospirillum doebereinerae]
MTDTDLIFHRKGSLGFVTLNRPAALNALSLDIVRRFDPQLRAWAVDPTVEAVVVQGAGDKAFCAGGDLKMLYQAGRDAAGGLGSAPAIREFFYRQYSLNRLIKRYPKPYIALMDGIVMGGGTGVCQHGSHRIGTERTLFAMPETAVGIFPDVGATYFLPRCPGGLGMFLGLTGARLKAADCLHAGLIDAHVPFASLDGLIDDLANLKAQGGALPTAIAAVIEWHAAFPGTPPLQAHRRAIDRCFGLERLEDIFAGLDAEGTEWAAGVLNTLRRMSPTSLAVAHEAMRRGADLEFEDCMVMEYRLSQALIAGPDFYEGVRAILVDRDNNPRWNPASVEAVAAAGVDRYFQPPPHDDLRFTDHNRPSEK